MKESTWGDLNVRRQGDTPRPSHEEVGYDGEIVNPHIGKLRLRIQREENAAYNSPISKKGRIRVRF